MPRQPPPLSSWRSPRPPRPRPPIRWPPALRSWHLLAKGHSRLPRRSCASASRRAVARRREADNRVHGLTPPRLQCRKRCLHLIRRKRDLAQPHARCIEYCIANGGGDGTSCWLTRTPGDRPRSIDERDLDLGGLGVPQDWVACPVHAHHLVAIPHDCLHEGPADSLQ